MVLYVKRLLELYKVKLFTPSKLFCYYNKIQDGSIGLEFDLA